jgi:hypothetical protein
MTGAIRTNLQRYITDANVQRMRAQKGTAACGRASATYTGFCT